MTTAPLLPYHFDVKLNVIVKKCRRLQNVRYVQFQQLFLRGYHQAADVRLVNSNICVIWINQYQRIVNLCSTASRSISIALSTLVSSEKYCFECKLNQPLLCVLYSGWHIVCTGTITHKPHYTALKSVQASLRHLVNDSKNSDFFKFCVHTVCHQHEDPDQPQNVINCLPGLLIPKISRKFIHD